MQLVQHIDEINLIRLLDLVLNDRAKLVIELLDQESITPFVHVFQNALVGFFVGDAVSMESLEILFVLLVDGLLMQHEERSAVVSGTHDARPLI